MSLAIAERYVVDRTSGLGRHRVDAAHTRTYPIPTIDKLYRKSLTRDRIGASDHTADASDPSDGEEAVVSRRYSRAVSCYLFAFLVSSVASLIVSLGGAVFNVPMLGIASVLLLGAAAGFALLWMNRAQSERQGPTYQDN